MLRLPIYQRILAELVRSRHRDGLLGAAGRPGPGQRGQGAQGPVAAGLVRHPGLGLRPRIPHRADRPRARRGRELVGGRSSGIGNLGRALTNSAGFASRGCQVTSLFDVDPAVVGEEIRGIRVRHMDEIATLRAAERPDIGVITTPGWAAQGVADLLVRAGVTSLLNFAPRVLTVPPTVHLRYVDLSIELQVLGFYRAREEEPGPGPGAPRP